MSKLSERLAEIRAEAKKIQDAADEAGRPKTAEEQTQFDAGEGRDRRSACRPRGAR